MKNHIFMVHLKRMCTNPAAYCCIALDVLVLQILMTKDGMFKAAIDCIMPMQGTGIYLITLLALPTLAYSMTCVEDKNTRMLYFWCIRSGTTSYALSYYIVALLSGFLTTFFGVWLGVALWVCRGFPLIGSLESLHFQQYAVLAQQGHPILYCLMGITDLAMGSMVVAGISAAAASLFRHKVTVLTAPMNLLWVINFAVDWKNPLYLHSIVLGQTATSTMGDHVLARLFAVTVYCVACGLISVNYIRREVQNG